MTSGYAFISIIALMLITYIDPLTTFLPSLLTA